MTNPHPGAGRPDAGDSRGETATPTSGAHHAAVRSATSDTAVGSRLRRAPGLRALAETITALTPPLLAKRSAAFVRIVLDWPTLAGEELANLSLPDKLVRPPGTAGSCVLRIRVASGAAALELQHLEPLILERINRCLGYPAVNRLKLVHAPLPHRPIRPTPPAPPPAGAPPGVVEQLVERVDNPALRQILIQLGQSIHHSASPGEPSARPERRLV